MAYSLCLEAGHPLPIAFDKIVCWVHRAWIYLLPFPPQAVPVLMACVLAINGCKKDKHPGCYSAKVIHIGQGGSDPCQSSIATLLTAVEGIPKGTNVSLVSHQTELNESLDQTIYFTLHTRAEIVPGILRGCTFDPKYMFQIDLCK